MNGVDVALVAAQAGHHILAPALIGQPAEVGVGDPGRAAPIRSALPSAMARSQVSRLVKPATVSTASLTPDSLTAAAYFSQGSPPGSS